MRTILSFFLAISSFMVCAQESKDSLTGIYEIMIYEHGGKFSIIIDENGNTNRGFKVDLTKLNQNIEKHLVSKNYFKKEAHNNPPAEAAKHEKGKKVTYVHVILKKDYYTETTFRTKTTYSFSYRQVDLNFCNYDILKLLKKSDATRIKNLCINANATIK